MKTSHQKNQTENVKKIFARDVTIKTIFYSKQYKYVRSK